MALHLMEAYEIPERKLTKMSYSTWTISLRYQEMALPTMNLTLFIKKEVGIISRYQAHKLSTALEI